MPVSERVERATRVEYTTPPGRYVVLYDGLCKFCSASAHTFVRWMGPADVELLDFQKPGALDRFPGLTHERCMRAMQLVTPAGHIFSGAEAVAQGLLTRRAVGGLARLYYAPLLRDLFDLGYAVVAANRYRIMGKAVAAGECADGTCALHLAARRDEKRLRT